MTASFITRSLCMIGKKQQDYPYYFLYRFHSIFDFLNILTTLNQHPTPVPSPQVPQSRSATLPIRSYSSSALSCDSLLVSRDTLSYRDVTLRYHDAIKIHDIRTTGTVKNDKVASK